MFELFISTLWLYGWRWMLSAFRDRKSKIIIEPNPHHIRAVFERQQGAKTVAVTPFDQPVTHWPWPKSSWFQRRREEIRNSLEQGPK
jgi:hypothetical protein